MTGLPDGSGGPPKRHAVLRAGWLLLGLLFVALGLVGTVVPLMPTTIFLILAAGCFARSSPRLESRLLTHPRFGPMLHAWRTEGAIPRRGKIAACIGISAGFLLFLVSAHPAAWLAGLVAIGLGGCAAWIVSRPLPGQGG